MCMAHYVGSAILVYQRFVFYVVYMSFLSSSSWPSSCFFMYWSTASLLAVKRNKLLFKGQLPIKQSVFAYSGCLKKGISV